MTLSEQQRAARERHRARERQREEELRQRERDEAQAREDAKHDLPRLLRVELSQFSPWRTFPDEDGCTSIAQLDGPELADAVIALPSVQRLLAERELLILRAETAEAALSIARRGWNAALAQLSPRNRHA